MRDTVSNSQFIGTTLHWQLSYNVGFHVLELMQVFGIFIAEKLMNIARLSGIEDLERKSTTGYDSCSQVKIPWWLLQGRSYTCCAFVGTR